MRARSVRDVASIQSVRGDYDGKVLSIRKENLRTLAVIYDRPVGSLTAKFVDCGVLHDEAAQLVTEHA